MDWAEVDEMKALIFARYFASGVVSTVAKPKKVASYLVESEVGKRITEDETDLEKVLKQKRDLAECLTSNYDPVKVESYWNTWWERKKFFSADSQKGLQASYEQKFVMVIPPPNVTGSLHIGHALFIAIQDSVTRWHRMQGKVTCWVPGVDHAGIATQSVVEKTLQREEKLTKYDLGRPEFLKRVWAWKEQYGDKIAVQFRRMGISVDWDRFAFTMDAKLSRAVVEAFVRFHEEGRIYRGNRLVNWSCRLLTAISDIEVDFIDIEKPTLLEVPGLKGKVEFGVLHKFAYKVKDSNEEIIVATTRLETMLGDTAVAVNSKDPRYTHLIGKELVHPFIPTRHIKVIADDELVEMEFGTGAVKVTPAHDFRDFECGQRNKLEFVNILNDDGTINENGGAYKGLHRFEVRAKMLKDMDALGIFKGKEPNKMRLGLCSRSNDVIEPLLRPQWYMKCKDVAEEMIEAVKKKELELIPSFHEATWNRWLENIHDWCISRQLWWGHQCPVYLIEVKGSGRKPDSSNNDDWVAARSLEEAYEKASKKLGVPKDQISLKQDDDVLDTWFSSGLFPLSVFGWPDVNNPDFKAFYPGHLLETGDDILFFWVARMVMMGLLLEKKLPFKQVFLHPIVRDAFGRKMSKSLGNIVDPLDLVYGVTLDTLLNQIKGWNLTPNEEKIAVDCKKKEYPDAVPPCGSDALRFGLLSYMAQGNDINLNVNTIISWRNFGNKIWNSFKFTVSKVVSEKFAYKPETIAFNSLSLFNKWILIRLNKATSKIITGFETYKFGDVTQAFYGFWMYEFCDIYLEVTKPILGGAESEETKTIQQILFLVLEIGLRLLHPMMPFLSEELYQKLPAWTGKAESITIAPFPKASSEWVGEDSSDQVDSLMNIVRTVRSLSASVNLPPSVKPKVFVQFTENNDSKAFIDANKLAIITLAKVNELTLIDKAEAKPDGCISSLVNKNQEVFIHVKDFIKVDKELERLDKRRKELEGFAAKLKEKMSTKDYETRVPEDVRKENREKLEGYLTELFNVEASQKKIASLAK